MPETYSHQLFEALRILLLAGVVLFAWKTAREAAEKSGRWIALRNGMLWSLGIALFAAVMAGRPSCEESDPLRGGCEQYADDGREVSKDERGGTFIFWAVLLNVPVMFGVMDGRRYVANPWRRPEPPADQQ
ncbi:hypothetical protein NED98_05710 [Sphingomonas sp. MMSM20]|uniref:hypothetical protein n=1 Tax=Sphingomonas lycopersici TaxID=2951807 RepID=UPI00223700DE|nr:hypothetical protein [Sphingomonas lycopersici]MCW6529736.1 hypothetical protein [Sphingomonas lycopersici]